MLDHLGTAFGGGGLHRRFVEVVEPDIAGKIGNQLLAALGGRNQPIESCAHLGVSEVEQLVAVLESAFEDRQHDRVQRFEA